MRKIEAAKSLAKKEIQESIKEIKKVLGSNLVAFIVYGSYVTDDFGIGSDIDCYVVVKKKTINGKLVAHILGDVTTKIYEKLRGRKEVKLLKKDTPLISLTPTTVKDLKDSLKKKEPYIFEVFKHGRVYYPHKTTPIEFFNVKISYPSKKKYMKDTFDKDVKKLLEIHTRQFIKKCILIARRLYLIENKEELNKKQIVKSFDREFKFISKDISLNKLNRYIAEGLNKKSVEELIKIIDECNKFLLEVKRYSLK